MTICIVCFSRFRTALELFVIRRSLLDPFARRTVWCRTPQGNASERSARMQLKTKIWLAVGAFVVAGNPAANDIAARPFESAITVGSLRNNVSIQQAAPGRVHLAAAKE